MAELGMRRRIRGRSSHPQIGDEPDPNGAERCEFLVAANPGQPPRALRKVASGGELSRISLALEVAALGLDPVGTMVFDEVDAGIGGASPKSSGASCAHLGAKRQVLCVTHLPQVAAHGHQHLRVAKSSSKRCDADAHRHAAKATRDATRSRACSAASRSRAKRSRMRSRCWAPRRRRVESKRSAHAVPSPACGKGLG